MGSVFHISEEDAARDFGALLRRVRSGDEAVVERPGWPVVTIKAESDDVNPVKGKTVNEILVAFARWESEHGHLAVDAGFADHVAEAHERLNRPLDSSLWD